MARKLSTKVWVVLAPPPIRLVLFVELFNLFVSQALHLLVCKVSSNGFF